MTPALRGRVLNACNAAQMFCALYDGDMFAKLDGKVCFVFQNVPQPWHPQTVYLHEVSLLVEALAGAFAKFVRAVYKEFAGGFGRFFDEDTYERRRSTPSNNVKL